MQRKLNIAVAVALLCSGLVNTSLQDQQMAKSLFQNPRPTLQSFAAGLVREYFSSDLPVATQNQLTHGVVIRQPSVKPETEQLREKLFSWFQQWVTTFQRLHSPEKAFVPYTTQLTKQRILKVEVVASFFRVCADSSVNSYLKCVATGDFEYAFQALDVLSRLIVYIIKYHGDTSGVNNDHPDRLGA